MSKQNDNDDEYDEPNIKWCF